MQYSTARMKLLPIFSAFMASATAINVSMVYQFPSGTWAENIVAMGNGSLLVSTLDVAQVRIVHPQASPATSSVIATFPNATGALGITEFQKDVFAVIVAQPASENATNPQSFSLWKLDLSDKEEGIKTSKMSELHAMATPNGMTALNRNTLLLADSMYGNIAAYNIGTGKTEVVLEDPSLAANLSAPGLQLGANGIKLHKDYIYYTNTAQALVGRVRVRPSTGRPNGFFETARDSTLRGPDDISVAKDGSIYVSEPLRAPEGDKIQHITLDGKVTTIAEGGLVVGSTASTFGRTAKDKSTLYLSTMGGFGADGKPEAGGRVVAIQLH
jgi:sugar lactone lactonase YvrE